MRISVVLILALLQPGYAVAIRHVTHKTLRAAGQPRSLDVDLNDLPPGFSLVSVPSPVSEAIPPPFQGLLRPSDDSNLPSTYQRPAFAQGGRHQKRDLTQIAQTVFDAAGLEPASTNAHLANLVRGLQTSRLIFDVISSFNPIALLSLTTATGINITAGMTVFESDLQQEPQVFLAPTSPSVSPVALLFFLLDADSPTPSNAANGQTVQMLAQDLTIDPTAANSQGFPLMSLAAESLAEYVPPVFADQSGPHRMIALIYQQPLGISTGDLSKLVPSGTPRIHFQVDAFSKTANLGAPIAAMWFFAAPGSAPATASSSSQSAATVQPAATVASSSTTISAASIPTSVQATTTSAIFNSVPQATAVTSLPPSETTPFAIPFITPFVTSFARSAATTFATSTGSFNQPNCIADSGLIRIAICLLQNLL